jgi:gas vesicle protein
MRNEVTETNDDHHFLMGLMTGTFIGAGLAMWFAPRTTNEIRQRVVASARTIRETASERYGQASTRVVGVVDELTRKSQQIRDEAADVVVRGAREVERFATEAKSSQAAKNRKHPLA